MLRKSYRTRGSNRRFENLQGFVNLPMDVMFEVSLCQVVLPYVQNVLGLSAGCLGCTNSASAPRQIAMYLDPKDVLQLSRLSKQFRSIFGSRSAIVVWRTVFRNLNRKCPPDISELQFAALLYDEFCMVQFLSLFESR